MHKITRDAFIYLEPRGRTEPEEFAQCGSCQWFNEDIDRCALFGKNDVVVAGASCGLYVPGDGTELQPMGLVTPKEAGYVDRQVRCENCAHFNVDKSGCELYYNLTKKMPDIFDLDAEVKPHACCNAQTPMDKSQLDKAAKRVPHRLRRLPPLKFDDAVASRLKPLILHVLQTTGKQVAAQIRQNAEKLAKYSDDQTRDDHGRWASGGGSFLYHGTSKENMPGIAQHGLKSGQGEDHLYFASSQEAAHDYAVGDHEVLRVPRDKISGLEYNGQNHLGGTNHRTRENVAPEHVQFKDKDGSWKPVSSYGKMTKAGVDDEERDDHGRWTSGGGGQAASLSGPFEDPQSNDYHYHATNAENASEIAQHGMVPHSPSFGTDQSTWPDGSREKRSYFGKPSNIHQFAPEHGTPVALRVKRDAAAFKTERGTGDVYTTNKIPASAFEIRTTTGWQSLRDHFSKVAKAAEDLGDLNVDIDVSGLQLLTDATLEEIIAAAKDGAKQTIAAMGLTDPEDIQQVNDAAVAWAKEHAGELVTQISSSTRDMVRTEIANGLANGWTPNQIANAIEDIDNYTFGEQRAALIASTETNRAVSQGALETYSYAKHELGVSVKKEWLADEEACQICLDNEAQGAIEIDDTFQSGDDAPPAHPSCACSLSPVVENSGSGGGEDIGDLASE